MTIVDYETYYSAKCSIIPLGTRGYFEHPEFDAYMVAIDAPGFQFVGHPKDAPWSKIIDDEWASHNASFDECLHLWLIEKGILPKWALPKVWHCTADLVAFLGCPRSLKESCKAILGLDLSKATRDSMKGKRWESMPDDFKQEVTNYALDDCIYSRMLWEACGHLWPEHERRLSRQTRRLGWAGAPVDVEKLDADIDRLEKVQIEMMDAIPWTHDSEKALSSKALATACREIGVTPPTSVAVDDEDLPAWLKKWGHTPAATWVKAIQTYRSANALLKKLHAMRSRTFNGRMDFNLKYAGAHTLRWSGGGGVNMQNLPRKEMFGVDVRSTFRAPEGKVFVLCDLSQIEPRVLHCLAGDKKFIAKLRANPKADLYDTQARTWGMWTGEEALEVGSPKIRQDVKMLNIGLGYLMGAMRFAISTGMTIEQAAYWVNFYRSINPDICALWEKLFQAFVDSIHSPDKTFHLGLPLRTMRYRNVNDRRGLGCVLNRNGKFVEQRIWTGILVENLVQAFARDVFATKLLEIEDAGYEIIWHIHDEVVVLCDEADAERIAKHIEWIMCRDVQWCIDAGIDLPLNAKAVITKIFKK